MKNKIKLVVVSALIVVGGFVLGVFLDWEAKMDTFRDGKTYRAHFVGSLRWLWSLVVAEKCPNKGCNGRLVSSDEEHSLICSGCRDVYHYERRAA